MLGDIGLVLIGAAIGVVFSETIRAFVRKATKGAFFGPGASKPPVVE